MICKRQINPVDEKGTSQKAFLAQDRVFWTSEGNENCQKELCVFSLDLKNNKTTEVKLPANILNLYDVKISPDGNNLLLQETKDGVDHLRVFRLKKDKSARKFRLFINGSYVISEHSLVVRKGSRLYARKQRQTGFNSVF
ncbi:MAG: hypothetical protein HC846_01245 [Blastocatellia bacterium]|nr:hypothetical protein [Blastocatellia bacterium]